jgi:CheY-like chemotaxis protein
LSNAIKFTSSGGRVQVILERVNSHIEITVSDTGVGIPLSFLPHVFDRFAQRDSATSRRYGGLGLGLAISKQLVELHGGSIQAKSRGEGQGATFVVNLPLLVMQEDVSGRVHPTTPRVDTENVVLPSLRGVRIIVADDEPDARDLVTRLLQNQGAIVVAVASAEAALQELSMRAPDLLISDIGMPGTDGYQLIRTIRAQEELGRRVPALALTAFARAEDRKRALVAGYQAHVSKPFDTAEFVLIVAGLVNRA